IATAAAVLHAGGELTPGEKLALAWQHSAARRLIEAELLRLDRAPFNVHTMPEHLRTAAEQQFHKERAEQAERNEERRRLNEAIAAEEKRRSAGVPTIIREEKKPDWWYGAKATEEREAAGR